MYPVSRLALSHDAGVEVEATSPATGATLRAVHEPRRAAAYWDDDAWASAGSGGGG